MIFDGNECLQKADSGPSALFLISVLQTLALLPVFHPLVSFPLYLVQSCHPFSYLTSCLLLGGCVSLFVVQSFVSFISSVLILFSRVLFSPIFYFQSPGHPFGNMQLLSIYTAEHQLMFFALCFPASVVFSLVFIPSLGFCKQPFLVPFCIFVFHLLYFGQQSK